MTDRRKDMGSFGRLNWILWLFVVEVVGGAATEVSGQSSNSADLEQRLLAVERGVAQGRIIAKHEALLAAEMSGRIRSLNVAEGNAFQHGDALAELNCDVERARLEKVHTSLEEAVKIRQTNERLAELRSVGDLELTLSQVKERTVEADVEVAAAQVQRCIVRAPFDGVVARVRKREAEYIRVGEPLLDVIDPTALEVEFLVPSDWLAWLDRNEPFKLHLNELPLQLSGEVHQIGVRVDPVSRTVRLKGQLTDELGGVVPGMSGDVRFEAAQ
ncbi:efflux RND transporter periplasmic adaptor subunit [Roseovarius sp. SYSU LYC5161]|uniref:efflux RND transporter periplasmic adaptor subunit n=1 Tax=Roseovarius halophilus (ex Wu et al. 2025) TaxID=3376060 RepID=UPI0039997D68